MRKAIAQTMSGKRVVIPIALLAAIAVFATLGSHFRNEEARANYNGNSNVGGLSDTNNLTKSATINVAPPSPGNTLSGGGQIGGNYVTLNFWGGPGGVVGPIVVTDSMETVCAIANVATPYPGITAIPGLIGLAPGETIMCSGNVGTVTWTIPAVGAGLTRSISIPIVNRTPVPGDYVSDSAQATWPCIGEPGGFCTAESNTVRLNDTLNAEVREFDVDPASEAAAGQVGPPVRIVSPNTRCVLPPVNALSGTNTSDPSLVFGVPPLKPAGPNGNVFIPTSSSQTPVALGIGEPCFYTFLDLITSGPSVNQGYLITRPQMFTVEDQYWLRGQREGLLGYHDGHDDVDDATGSQHMVCLMAMMAEDAGIFPTIVWNILPTAGSAATINPPQGTKIFRWDLPGYNTYDAARDIQYGVNCVVWRSSGTGGQNITASVDTSYVTQNGATPGDPVNFPAGPNGGGPRGNGFVQATGIGPTAIAYWNNWTQQPKVKEWNTIDWTKIVAIPSGEGSVGTTIWGNSGSLAWWRIPGTVLPITVFKPSNAFCLRDPDSLVPINFTVCANYPDVDWAKNNTVIQAAAPGVNPAGLQAGMLRPSSRAFIDYVYGGHKDFQGTIDGALQTYTLNPLTGINGGVGTCGSLRVEDPVDGLSDVVVSQRAALGPLPDPLERAVGAGGSVSVLNSDMGVAFQIFNTQNATSTGASDCNPNEFTVVRIQTREEVQLRSDLDGAPDEYIVIQWTLPVAAKKVFLAWAGQRIILEQDWRAFGGDRDDDPYAPISRSFSEIPPPRPVTGLVCTPATAGRFSVTYLKGTGPGNFLPELGAQLTSVDQAVVSVRAQNVQFNGEAATVLLPAFSDMPQGSCISRVLYESEDPGEVDIEAFTTSAGGSYTVGSESMTLVQISIATGVDVNVLIALNPFLAGSNPTSSVNAGTVLTIGGGAQGAASKVAFVVYYMKIEDVKVSLIKDVEKPTHNGPSNANIFSGGGYDPNCVLSASDSQGYGGYQYSAGNSSSSSVESAYSPYGCGDINDFPYFLPYGTIYDQGPNNGGVGCYRYLTCFGLSAEFNRYQDPGTNGDYAFKDDKGNFTTGNPWDASKDVTEVDWNVSKDLLVRIRVRGWFLNANPSGRAREESDPLNIRPADRWIMPDDWVVLAGGPGTAEQFNPQYDLMIAPNNTGGKALMDPTGRVGYTGITTLAVALSAGDNTATVASAAGLPVGACILIDNEWLTVVQKQGNVLTLGRFNLITGGLTVTTRSAGIGCSGVSTSPASHASGARVAIWQLAQPLVLVPTFPVAGAVPFEGPLSLIDLPGLASSGTAGGSAALSNLAPGNIRDTIWADGAVNFWDAPMPPLPLTVDIRGAGFIRQVWKYDVYYLGQPNSYYQTYPNPYYVENIPGSPFIVANNFTAQANATGYFWSSWGNVYPGGGLCPGGAPAGIACIGATGQGPYTYWQAMPQWVQNVPNSNARGLTDTTVNAAERRELAQIRLAYGALFGTLAQAVTPLDTSIKVVDADAAKLLLGSIIQIDDEFMIVTGVNGNVVLVTRNANPFGLDPNDGTTQGVAHAIGTIFAIFQTGRPITMEAGTIGRTLVIYSDNHGEGMVTANGDFKLDYSGCATNVHGGKHCAQGDKVGTSTINAVANYPDFSGKHPPVKSNDAKVTWTWGGYKEITIEKGETDQFKYVVLHKLDRDGWCLVPAGAISLHPVLTAIDELLTVGAHDPDETVDFLMDGGAGKIIDWAGLARDGASGERGEVTGVETYSTSLNDPAAGGFREFPTLHSSKDECQAWIKISSSLLDVIDITAIEHDDEGDIGFDRVIDFTNTTTYQLSFRWSLITWAGADGISPTDALKGTGPNAGGTDIFSKVTAVYGWNQSAQTWQAFFPSGVGVPGANDLTGLKRGQAYWIAIVGPDSVTWTIVSNVN